VNDQLFEQLLNEEEGTSLDFKRDQYAFVGASDDDKSEILKDILALANSWRRTPAYILVGVQEVRGGRSVPVGVQHHLADNDLQQFVNSKTQRPITFHYVAYPFEGTQVAVIEVSHTERPVYLTRPFGKLQANTVYVRRGSSTDVADPDEIARMGASFSTTEHTAPRLNLEWADLRTREALGTDTTLEVLVLDPPIDPKLIRPRQSGPLGHYGSALNAPPPGYYEDVIKYTGSVAMLGSLGLVLINSGRVPAQGVVMTCSLPRRSGLRVLDPGQYPSRPFSNSLADFAALTPRRSLIPSNPPPPEPDVTRFDDRWEIVIPFGKVLPQGSVWTSGSLHIGSQQDEDIVLDAKLLADNLPEPLDVSLSLSIKSLCRAMAVDDVFL
jgi:hypothetical protein